MELVRVEVLTAVVMRSPVFWDVTSCSPVKVNRHYGGTCRLYLQCQRVSQAKDQHEAGRLCLLPIGVLLRLLFDPVDGGDVFLRNVCLLSPDYTAIPEDRSFHNHRCENLKSYVVSPIQNLFSLTHPELLSNSI
jgi:hypothetical protein